MKFIGFNFNKINVERFSNNLENLKIKTKIDISTINLIKESLIEKDNEILKVEFQYNVDYNPDFAKISLSGEIFMSDKAKIIKEVTKKWNKDKSMDEDFKLFLFNIILRKCNLKSLQLEDEMNLPLHLPFPSIKKEDNKDK